VDDRFDPQKARQRRLALALRQNLAKRKTRVKAGITPTMDGEDSKATPSALDDGVKREA
jgi:hypothetical protein